MDAPLRVRTLRQGFAEVFVRILVLASAAAACRHAPSVHRASYLDDPPDGNDYACAAAFVLEGDVVTWQPILPGEHVRTATLRVTNPIKGAVPSEVGVVLWLPMGWSLYPGDHVVVIGDVKRGRHGTPKLVMRTRPIVRDTADVARFPIPLQDVTPSKLQNTGPWTFRPMPGRYAPRPVVFARWSPEMIVVVETSAEIDFELPHWLHDADARSLGAPWAEIVRQIAAAPHSAPGCTPPGTFVEP